jgi:hypothetical protein
MIAQKIIIAKGLVVLRVIVQDVWPLYRDMVLSELIHAIKLHIIM